jgi:hypothetical protein
MAHVQEISNTVKKFLAGKLPLAEFEDWAAEYSWNIHQRTDAEAQQLAYLVQSKVGDFDDGYIDERSLRRELAAAIRPFEQKQAVELPPVLFLRRSLDLTRGRRGFTSEFAAPAFRLLALALS